MEIKNYQERILDYDLPFSENVRSIISLKQSEKRHFTGPSIACSLLNLTEEKLINDLETFGFMFESLVERDLKVYAKANGYGSFHYQDYDDDEIDHVIELEDGSWCAFEIKLGANKIDEAAKNLIKISAKLKKPKIVCVVCSLTNAAYKRPNGVYVVSITSLKD